MTGGVAAVVLGARGEAAIAAALAGLEWAATRVVLDPSDRLGGIALPPGVRRVTGDPAAAVAGASWALLVGDDERVTPALARAIVAATAAGDAAVAIPRALAAGSGLLRVAGAAVRLVPAAEAQVRPPVDGTLAWRTRRPVRRLDTPLVVAEPASLEQAVIELDGETTALAALPGMATARVGVGAALLAPAAATLRLLVARGARLGWGRWVRAVLAGYRVLVLQAKRWERAQEVAL